MLDSGDTGAVHKTMEDALTILRETVQKTKSVIYELRPAVLDDYGLYPALQWYAGQLAGRTSVKVIAQGDDLKKALPSATENAIFRIVQEACTNSLRHSGASSIYISLKESDQEVVLEVYDDGCGFDPELQGFSSPGLGITGMKERAHLTGGELLIRSGPGAGTCVILTIRREP
jgi:signal transduction histidine kinase